MALDGYYVARLETALARGIDEGKNGIIVFLANHIYPIYQTACQEANISQKPEIRLFYSSSQTLPECCIDEPKRKYSDIKMKHQESQEPQGQL
jgi:hypothetical protein